MPTLRDASCPPDVFSSQRLLSASLGVVWQQRLCTGGAVHLEGGGACGQELAPGQARARGGPRCWQGGRRVGPIRSARDPAHQRKQQRQGSAETKVQGGSCVVAWGVERDAAVTNGASAIQRSGHACSRWASRCHVGGSHTEDGRVRGWAGMHGRSRALAGCGVHGARLQSAGAQGHAADGRGEHPGWSWPLAGCPSGRKKLT